MYNEAVILLHWHFYTFLQMGTKVEVIVTVHLNMGVTSGYTHLITSGDYSIININQFCTEDYQYEKANRFPALLLIINPMHRGTN